MNRDNKSVPQFFFRVLLALGLMLGLSWASPAAAAGRVVWTKTTISEKGGDGQGEKGWWRLELEIHLPRAPSVAWYSMRFEFEPVAYYERALLDGKEGPQDIVQTLHGQQSLIETQDVGFQDPGTGQTQARTKFTFKVTRGHGYEAGEYKVTIRDGQTGGIVGSPAVLKLKGENKVVDRRSMVFQANDTKKKKKSEPAPEATAEPEPTAPEEAPASEPTEGPAPPPVEERPGGGCHVAAGPHAHFPSWPLWVLGLAGVGFVVRQRKSSRPTWSSPR